MAENIDPSVVTFNIGVISTKKDGLGIKPAKEMIDEFLRRNRPSLLYLQENTWVEDNIEGHVPVIGEKYKAVSHKHFDATVLYRENVLEDQGSEELHELFKEAFRGNSHLKFETFELRASFSKLKIRSTGTTFIAISWHGEHNGLDIPTKIEKFKDLIRVIKRMELPVVLGGDFNIILDDDDVKGCIEDERLEVYDYEPHENRPDIIDFFVVTPDVELSEVNALGDYMRLHLIVNGEKELSFHVFDHAPVQAKISFVESESESTPDDQSTPDEQLVESMSSLGIDDKNRR